MKSAFWKTSSGFGSTWDIHFEQNQFTRSALEALSLQNRAKEEQDTVVSFELAAITAFLLPVLRISTFR
jgi:hypothetical protein